MKLQLKRLLPYLPRALTRRLVLRKLHGDATAVANVEVKLADTEELHHAAAQLAFDAYAGRGLVNGLGVPVRVTPYLLLPSTYKFVALVDGELVATMSLILDSPLGLPLEAVFAGEVDALRAQGRRLAEVGALAIKPGRRGKGLAMLVYKAMWRTATELLGVQDLVIAVHPDAAPMYEVPLLFERLSRQVRCYPGLEATALAAGLRLNLETFPQRLREAFATDRAGELNPRRFFLEEEQPQIQLPAEEEQLQALRQAGARAALRLASLRPETVMGLRDADFHILQTALNSEQARRATAWPRAFAVA